MEKLQKLVFKKENIILYIFNIFVFIILVNEAFKVVPSTEGWFGNLTSNKNFIEIIFNDEILLPPLYPIFINLINKLSSQLILLRFTGILFGYLLFNQTTKVIMNGLEIFLNNNFNLKFRNISVVISSLLILYVINISSYLIWYDFTIIVLIMQLLILNLSLSAVKTEDFKKFKIYIQIGILLNLGILLKHSNMGIYFICIQFALLIISFLNKNDRKYILKLFRWQFLLVSLFILVLFVYTFFSRNDVIEEFITASLDAKGGFLIVSKFIKNGFNHLFLELQRYQVWLMGLFIYLYSSKFKFLKLYSISIFVFLWAYTILRFSYNISGFSVQATSLFIVLSSLCIIDLIIQNLSKKKYIENEKKFNCLILFTFSSVGCLIGNFTSAGLGYNGYYIGLLIGIILQICFFLESLRFLNQEIINLVKK